uniref:ABC transporter permease n=1 Tax=Pontibacterium sp. TaxID=2036026 RepID=UPI0035146ED3
MIDYIQNTFADLKAKKDIWWYLSKQDINSQFRRSKVGSLWLVVNQLCFAFGAGLIWAAVFGLDPIEFIPFIATGFAVWGFVASCFVEGSSALVVSQGYIKQVNMPITVYIMRSVSSNVIRLAIGLAVAVMVVFTFGGMKLVNPVYILPGLVLLLVTGFFVSVFCGLVGAKYRD